MDIKLLVGHRIKEIRSQKSMSQEDVANTADMERSFVTHIESGRRNISVDTLQRLLDALDVSFKDFFSSDEFSKL
jgi:transcriptional regulator with XRE-family HTH domain